MKKNLWGKGNNLLNPGPDMYNYVFSHFVLRNACFLNPSETLSLLSSSNYQNIIKELWKLVCLHPLTFGHVPTFSPRDIKVTVRTIARRSGVIVKMPYPKNGLETYMIGIVPGREFQGNENKTPDLAVYYFTLEKPVSCPKEGKAFVCGWLWDRHINYLTVIDPYEDYFVSAIEKIILKGADGFSIVV